MSSTTIPTIQIPKCEPGIGKLIFQPDSTDLIEGVRIEPHPIWADDRGYFLEIARLTQGLGADFPPATTQVSAALTYHGAIKAFHFHLHQTDLWCVTQGMFQVALVDLRPDSPTFGLKNTLYVGQLRPWRILIPPGVGHGYKVIGITPAMLVYLTDRLYNPKDEGRIAYNEPGIAYDWELQHK
ncbi:dTDP-4-dehydrorhamnose 3,5-epimerase family protein [Paludibaculum fermentans]|uniref:dTDP-4-dehydrorhamnose 3,5-epimerase n=1 Tax=Paludibaculum fermentans TaxID=1473598 RepID=A0A7S7NN45_PALFE|nr:dTDP-4-dehydrorhamnose 3,5-epimerase family protein [Paludibaculum fermentans]QOY86671.1 dTDP-4-dehydrorhamnose 3,5-epimerase family protein [Paludibaculum fermentans]